LHKLKKIALFYILIYSPLLCSFSATAAASNFIDRWDNNYNEAQKSLDSFLIKNEEDLLALKDFQKFEVLFYQQELKGNNIFQGSGYQKIIESIESEKLKFLLKVHQKILHEDTINNDLIDRTLLLVKNRFSTHYDGIINVILSKMYFAQAKIGQSLKYIDRAINRAKLGKLRNLMGAAFLHKSNIYLSENLTERAYANSQKGLYYAKQSKAIYWQVLFHQKLGEIQFHIQNYSIAKDHWEAAYILAENKVHEFIFGRLTRQLSSAYFYIENYNTASNLLNDALIIFYRQANAAEISKTHFLIGRVLNALDESSLAERNFKLSLSYAEAEGDEAILEDIYTVLARFYFDLEDYRKSLNYLDKALQICVNGSVDFYELLYIKADIYSKLNKTKKSSELYKVYIAARDSIEKAELQSRIAELNSLFRSEQRERKIVEQQKNIDEKESQLLLNSQELENEQLRIRQLFILIIFIVLLFVVIIILVSLRNKQTKLKQENKSSELKQNLLRSQMNPHFIFNSFSIIQSYIYENDKEASSEFLVNFSRLIRMILENSNKELIPLNEEIEILKRYLYVQKTRFEERFHFKIEIGYDLRKDLHGFEIPPMIAQPFIENAIEHGDLQHSDEGLILIKLQKKGDLIEFVIEDNGIGIDAGRKRKSKKHRSMATRITEERISLLNQKHGVDGVLKIVDLSTENKHGTKVVIQIPYIQNIKTTAD
jgi:tetratricopeptide (TPR) repeat protein